MLTNDQPAPILIVNTNEHGLNDMTCTLTSNCKASAEFNVIHKAVGARAAFTRTACRCCAARIGKLAPSGAVIDAPNMDSIFYKLEAL